MLAEHAPRPLGRVLLTGATGMVGSAVLCALLEDNSATEVVSLGRRLSGHQHSKLTEIEVRDFGDADALRPHVKGIDTLCHCLATYSSRVSQADYQKITVAWLDALLSAIEIEAPEATFCLFSAQGARPDGGGMSFALKTKGKAESILFDSNVARKFAFRPGYIAPSKPRTFWKLADHLFVYVQRILPSIGLTSAELAHALLATATNDIRRSAVLENAEMRSLRV